MTSFHSLSYYTIPSCLQCVYCHVRKPTVMVKRWLLPTRKEHEYSTLCCHWHTLKQQKNAWQINSSQGWWCPSLIPVLRSRWLNQERVKPSWTGIRGKILSQKQTNKTFNLSPNLCFLGKVKGLIHFSKNVRDWFERKLVQCEIWIQK